MRRHPQRLESPLVDRTNGKLCSSPVSAPDSGTAADVTNAARNKFGPHWSFLQRRQWRRQSRSEPFWLGTMAAFDNIKQLYFGPLLWRGVCLQSRTRFGLFSGNIASSPDGVAKESGSPFQRFR